MIEKKENNLMEAAVNGNTKLIEMLLANGANVHADNDFAIRIASNNGHTQTVSLLIDNGAHVSAKNEGALKWAAEEGHTEVVRVLLENGADIHHDHDTSLKRAAEYGHSATLSLMIVDFNMTIKPETKAYLEENNFHDALKIINARDLNKNLSLNLNPKTEKKSMTMKL